MDLVFGPLPKLHRLLVIATALAAGMLSGMWLVEVIGLPTAVPAGIGWGLLAGLLLNYVLLHDFHHQGRPVRVRRH
jgi:predicted ABC-type sugar transport system permease subunit